VTVFARFAALSAEEWNWSNATGRDLESVTADMFDGYSFYNLNQMKLREGTYVPIVKVEMTGKEGGQ
jgi:hypothetical protein